MKAQLLSLDFLLAAVILTMALGIFVYNTDLVKKNLQFQSELLNNNAETIADLYANGNQIRLSNELTGKYCVDYSDDSSTCPSDFERDCIDSQSGLNKRVFSTTRLVTCPSSNEACVLMVKTCE